MCSLTTITTYSTRTTTASFKADPEVWSQFKETCRIRSQGDPVYGDTHGQFLSTESSSPMGRLSRGVHVCCVMESLMLAWIEGQRAEATVIKPVTVNMTLNHVVKRQRRRVGELPVHEVARGKTWPPSCMHAHDFIRATREVGCLDLKDWIKLEKCWRCHLAKGR